MQQRLMRIIAGVENRPTAPTDQTVNFLQYSIIDCLLAGLTSALPQTSARSYTGARLVSETEDYIDAAGERPVHISELCAALRVSRRSLHRAFADTLGIGPAAYLRCRRLSTIQSILRRSDPATTSISDLAFEYGFQGAGRFASYYRAYFGENPSETFRSGTVSTNSFGYTTLVEATTNAGFPSTVHNGAAKAVTTPPVILDSMLTCPGCGHMTLEEMPTNSCQFFHKCVRCHMLIRPIAGDCCVFCSYGSVKCPPVQIA
jgi:AraC family ethanolamine operon transcriptional activator